MVPGRLPVLVTTILRFPLDATTFVPYWGASDHYLDSLSMIFGGKSTTIVRQSVSWDVTPGPAYDVRFRRLTADSTGDPSISDAITWTALRTFSDVQPIQKSGLARQCDSVTGQQ